MTRLKSITLLLRSGEMSLIDSVRLDGWYNCFFMRCFTTLFCLFAGLVFLVGCSEKTISISSNPSGAIVWVNDREVGRTPVRVDFLYDGEYDVRVEKNGYEPVMVARWAKEVDSPVRWNFDLLTRDDSADSLLDRARTLRTNTLGGSGE